MSRCNKCNKKLGVLEYKCKCGKILCISHLHAEEHNCSFNYKQESQSLIKKQIQVGKLIDKIERI